MYIIYVEHPAEAEEKEEEFLLQKKLKKLPQMYMICVCAYVRVCVCVYR